MKAALQKLRFTLWKLWLARTWPIKRRAGMLACALNKHWWEDAPALDNKGIIVTSKPGRYLRCRRPDCRVFRGKPLLLKQGPWLETDDFIVLARMDCKHCHGRGYRDKMLLPSATKAPIPCQCLRIQPGYIERVVSLEELQDGEETPQPSPQPRPSAA